MDGAGLADAQGGSDTKASPKSGPDDFSAYGASLSSLAQSLEKSSGEATAALAATRPKKMALLDQLAAEKPPAAPDIAKPEAPPKPPGQADPLQSFGSFASALGIFGGLLSRHPLTASLKAASAAIQGAKQHDQEAYQRAFDEWKVQSEYAAKVADWQYQRYRTVLEQNKGSHDQIMSQLQVLASLDQDATALHAIRSGDIGLFEKMMDDRYRMIQGLKDSSLKVKQFDEEVRYHNEMMKTPEHQATLAFMQANPNATPDQWAAFKQSMAPHLTNPTSIVLMNAMEQYALEHGGQPMPPEEQVRLLAGMRNGTPDPKTVEQTAQGIAAYQIAPPSSFVMKTPFGQEVMSRVMELNPKYQSARYGEVTKAARDFGTGKQGDTVRSFNVAVQHLGTLEELLQALQSGDIKALNRAGVAFQEQFGGPAPASFDAAAQIVGDEIIKAVIGGKGALGDRDAAGARLSAARSPAQLQGVIDTYKKLMAGQLIGLEKQYQDTTGLDDFETKLLPDTKKALGAYRKTGASPDELVDRARAAWGSYEPDKYDYRVDPATGKLQRKLKNG